MTNNLILPGKPSFAKATAIEAKSLQQREKEIEQRERILQQEADKINQWKVKLAMDERIEARRRVEQAWDFAVRTETAIKSADEVIERAHKYLNEIDSMTTALVTKETATPADLHPDTDQHE